MIDWSLGRYERTAAELAPVAEVAVAAARLSPGMRALDLGCGSGNVAKRAVAAGAHVVGVDPAVRLLEVARTEVPEAEFVEGTAESIPFEDEAFDAVISVFAVIFSSRPEDAAGEILRVLRPGGRAVITTWRPEGPIHSAFGLLGQAMAKLAPGPPSKPFGWGEPDRVRGLFEPLGVTVDIVERELSFEAPSAEAFMAESEEFHPMLVAGKRVLEQAGSWEDLRSQAVAKLEEGSDPGEGFCFTSRYLVVSVSR